MALAEIPNGSHTFSDYLDSDGVGSGPIKLSVTVEVKDQDITLDFTDNPDQVKGAINLPLSALRAAVYYSVRSIVDPALPANGGYYRAIEIRPGQDVSWAAPSRPPVQAAATQPRGWPIWSSVLCLRWYRTG